MKDDNIRQAIDSTMQSTQTYTLVIRRQPVKFNSVMLEQFWTRRLQSMHTHAVRHVSFMQHLKKYVDRINTKYMVEIWYRIALTQLAHLVPQGSKHMDGAILLATRWSR